MIAQSEDRRIVNIVKSCQELPGQDLLQYVDSEGSLQGVTSGDVNDYLKSISGQDITAKDFRTWAGTVLAALALHKTKECDTAGEARTTLRDIILEVSSKLGNTPTICRKCYIHPKIMIAHLAKTLTFKIKPAAKKRSEELSGEESAVLAFLKAKSD